MSHTASVCHASRPSVHFASLSTAINLCLPEKKDTGQKNLNMMNFSSNLPTFSLQWILTLKLVPVKP